MTDASPRVPRRSITFAVFVYGTLVASVFAFFVYGRQGVIASTVDLNGFGGLARNLARGEGFSTGYGPTTRRAPLYPLLGAALLKVFGTDAPGIPEAVRYRPMIVANCVIMGLTCLAVWSLARRIFGWRTALLAAFICPLIPQSLRYVGMTEVETLMGLWTVLLALSSYVLLARPTPVTGASFGVTVALATLTKPIALLYPLAFLPLAFWHWNRARALGRRAFIACVVACVCLAALLLPWSLRNRSVTDGQFSGISSNAPGEFLRGYINAQSKYFLLRQDFGGSGPREKWDPEANAWEENFLRLHGLTIYRPSPEADGRFSPFPAPPPGVTSAMLEVEKDRVESAEMTRRVLHEPASFVRKFLVQLGMFWYIVETRQRSLLVGLIALAVLGLSVGGAVRARREGVVVWPVLLVVVYFNAIYAAVLAFARYSMPLFPVLSVLAAGGLMSIPALIFRRSQTVRFAGTERVHTPGGD